MDMLNQIIRYCEHDVWAVNVHELSGFRQFGVKLLRLGLVAAAEFQESFLSIRATSLVYTTLAVAGSILSRDVFRPQSFWRTSAN